jgi:hypothetical protein
MHGCTGPDWCSQSENLPAYYTYVSPMFATDEPGPTHLPCSLEIPHTVAGPKTVYGYELFVLMHNQSVMS